MVNKTASEESRRDFLTKLGTFGALGVAVAVFARNLFLFNKPPKPKVSYHKYLVGKVNEIPKGKAKEILIQKKPVFVVHLEDGFKVLSGVCTHLGCIVRWEENKNRFYCPCHKGFFDQSGNVIGGPPPTPLEKYDVTVDGNLVFVQVKDKEKGHWS